MTPGIGGARSWTCADCGVTSRYGAGKTAPKHPEGWAKKNGKWHCLRCRREHAMDLASAENAADGKSQRRRALMEFELVRDPAAPDTVIAKRVRCSSALVRPVRVALREQGKLPPG